MIGGVHDPGRLLTEIFEMPLQSLTSWPFPFQKQPLLRPMGGSNAGGIGPRAMIKGRWRGRAVSVGQASNQADLPYCKEKEFDKFRRFSQDA
jgi:hypothetical protein